MQASQAKSSDVTLPRAILRRSANIEARIAARNAETETPPAEQVPPVNPVSEPVAAPPVEVPTSPVEPAPVTDPRETDPAYWKQRFKVTEGVLRSERSQRQAETADVNRRMTELQEQIRALQAEKPKPETDIDVTQFFTPEQVDQFGEDQCKAMARAATKSAQAEVQRAIDETVKPLREAQARKETQTVEDRKRDFTDKLAELVPDYAEIDVDPAWLSWLAQEDEATGLERQAILNNHIHAMNAAKVAKVFADFLKSKAPKPTPPVVGAGRGAGPSGDAPPVAALGSLKAPTDVEVKDFYKRAALGRVKDAERIEFESRMKLRTGGR